MGWGTRASKGIEDAAREAMACAGDDLAPLLPPLPAEFARHFVQGFAWTSGAGAAVLAIMLAARAVLR